MTVAELIKELKYMPKDKKVVVLAYDNDTDFYVEARNVFEARESVRKGYIETEEDVVLIHG